MPVFSPTIAVLPGHPVEPGFDELYAYAEQLDTEFGIDAVIPRLPNGLWHYGSGTPIDTSQWDCPNGIIATSNLDHVHEASIGAHGVLIVNAGKERDVWGGTIAGSISNVILSAARLATNSNVPIALTHRPEWDGRDSPTLNCGAA